MPDEPTPPPIVVTGRREGNDDGSVSWTFVRSSSGTAGIRDVTPPMVSEYPGFDQVLEISVLVEQTDSETDAVKIHAAAKALIQAIARARDALKASDRSPLISVNGVAVSLGTLLDAREDTDFTVSDRPDSYWANGSVGAAPYSRLGRHSSPVSYRAIGAVPAHPAAGYYGHPNFGGLGMVALVLHEAFHLTPQGDLQFHPAHFRSPLRCSPALEPLTAYICSAPASRTA